MRAFRMGQRHFLSSPSRNGREPAKIDAGRLGIRGFSQMIQPNEGPVFEHIRIVGVARSKVEWVTFEPSVSKSGGLGTLVSAYQKGKNHELLCVSRSAWGGSPPRSILYGFERRISDRNVQHLRRGYGVPCVEGKN